MLFVILFCLLALPAAEAKPATVLSGPMVGQPLRGPLNGDGFLKLVFWPRLFGEPPAVYEEWCRTRKVGDASTAVFALRTNRCMSSSLGPGADLTDLAFNARGGAFIGIQTNQTHFATGVCSDELCQNCTFGVRTLPSCFPGLITASSGSQATVVISPSYQADLPVLPSPLLCTQVIDTGTCQGEILVQGCIAQCFPVSITQIAHAQCNPVTGQVIVTMCDLNGGLGMLQCRAGPCPKQDTELIPATVDGCVYLRSSDYGYKTVGCTITGNSGLSAHPCGGMNGAPGAQCDQTDESISIDGQQSYQVDGSYVPSNSRTTIRNPTVVSANAVDIKGALAPNGELKLEFATVASVPINEAIPVFTYSESVAQNVAGSMQFSSVTTSVLENGESKDFCSVADYGSTTLSVTIQVGACGSGGLSRGGVIGVAVAGSILFACLVAAIIGGLVYFARRDAKMFSRMRGQTTDYVSMGSGK